MRAKQRFNLMAFATNVGFGFHHVERSDPIRSPFQPRHRHRNPTTFRIHAARVAGPPRRSGNFMPDLWSYEFIHSSEFKFKDEEVHKRRHEELKEEVRVMMELMMDGNDVLEILELVDSLQQLGLGYHFEKEIQETFTFMSQSNVTGVVEEEDDLHSTALLLRVFRENNIDISQRIFQKFLDHEKGFLSHGIREILSSYEASFYNLPGETLLDEIRTLTTNHLKEVMNSSETDLPIWVQEKVNHALDLPIHWRMPRLQTRLSIDMYSMEESMNPTLLELAKLDFNMVQSQHMLELREASRWSKETSLGEKLPFARHRIVECFFWGMGMLPQPEHGYFRIGMAKIVYLIYLLDDIYDVYGTPDELELFTDAVGRWELKAMEQLPEYMKIFYLALFNTTNEINYHVLNEKGLDVATYSKESWVSLCKTYLQESKWYNEQYIPTPEEYIKNASITIGVPIALYFTYIMIDDKEISSDSITQLLLNPSILMVKTAKICRLLNDLATSTDELKRGDVRKSAQCRIHHDKVSEEEAREGIRDVILKTWVEVNKGRSIATSLLPKPVVDAAINLLRSFYCFHKDGDGQPETIIKDKIMSLLFQSLKI